MPQLNTDDVTRSVPGSRLIGEPAQGNAVVADSRQAGPGVAFAAVRGGHAFVAHALSAGSPYAIVEQEDVVPEGGSAVVVEDTVDALMQLAVPIRSRLHVDVVAITGSTGKTLTKDFIAAALGSTLRVHATPNSYNAEIGVPLTMFGTPDDAQVLVLELAARRAGEIARLSSIAQPQVGVVTGIGSVHIELFGSRVVIAQTKGELLDALPADGLAIVPSDDDFLDLLSAASCAPISTVGPGGQVRYSAERIDQQGRTHGRVWVDGAGFGVILPVPGRALMRNAALAIRVATRFGIDPVTAAAAIEHASVSAWRMQTQTMGEWTVVNDAWNANPTSVASTLRAVAEMAAARPAWAVLGRMAELGDSTEHEHRRAGRLLAALGYAGVIVVGEEAAAIGQGAGAIAHPVGSVAEAAGMVKEKVPPGAVVVVKASRVAGLERLVDELGNLFEVGSERTG